MLTSSFIYSGYFDMIILDGRKQKADGRNVKFFCFLFSAVYFLKICLKTSNQLKI